MALAVPLSRFTSLVGGGSAFYVRPPTPPSMKHIFFKSPIGRLAFLGRHTLAMMLMMVGVFSADSPKADGLAIGIAASLFFGGAIYMLVFTIIPRFMSVGLSRWFALLILVPPIYPLIFLFLLFCPEGQFVKHETVA